MQEAALSSNLGRCPTCGQLVTLPAEASHRVVCPKCRHQARAAAFEPVAAPLPVLLAPSNAEEIRAAAADDDERTHLLLDLPCEEDDAELDAAQTLAPHSAAAKLGAPARRRLAPPGRRAPADDERTHLLLNASDLQDEPEAPGAASPQPRSPPLAHALGGEEERTHLMLGPVSVRAEQTFGGRILALLGRALPPTLRFSAWLDEALHERWLWALGTVAVGAGLIAPSLDYWSSQGNATLGGSSVLFSAFGLGLLGLARLNGLRRDDGGWDPSVLGPRLRSELWLSLDSVEHWERSSRHLRLSVLARALAWIGLTGFAWAALIGSLRLVFGLGAALSSLPTLSGLLLLAAVVLELRARRAAPVPALFLQDFGNALAAAAALPAIVDLAEPLPAQFSSGTTALHESLLALVKWRPRDWPDEAAYRAALQRHLQRHMPGAKLERERWMGASRLEGVLDLVINGMIVVGVKRGFDATGAERAIGQMSRYARAWSGKPLLLVIFEAPRAAVFEGANARLLQGAHEEFSLLTVRMPQP